MYLKNLATVTAGALAVALIAPSTALAQAKTFADQTIELVAAYKVDDANRALTDKKEELGSTAYYKGAEGYAKLASGKLDEAVTLLDQAATLDAADPAADYYRGEANFWKKSGSAATSAWTRSRDRAKAAVAKTPDDARANFYLGAAQVRLKEYGPARTALAKAKEKGFSASMVDFQVGLSYAQESKWQEAKTALDLSIAANSGFAPAYFYRARVWKELKRTDEMMLDLDRFLKLAPTALEAPIAKSLLAAGGG